MQFIVSSSQLLKQLQVLVGIVNTNNTLPILDNFLFELTTDKLKITASDIETIMSSSIEVQSEYEGSIAINARLLLEAIKTFPEQPLTFIIKEKILEISSDFGKYDMAFHAGDDFPKTVNLEEPVKTVISSEILASAINYTVFATGNDDLRPVMSGVFFQFNSEGLTFVATDAHKLVKYERTDLNTATASEFIMPKKPLNILKNILGSSVSDVIIEYNNTNAKFSFDKVELICRLIDGKYPNYDAVIPKNNPNRLTVNRSSFLNSVRRASIFSSKSTYQIRLKMAGTELNISAEDPDFSNKADERLTCNFEGEDMQIGFNSKFLIEMLNNLNSEDILIEMSVPSRAGILTPLDGNVEGEHILMLVMPVMLNN
jgi:DNA polymerase-3 subunit beta